VSLSSDGNTLAVGATGEDSSATGVNGDQGDAYPASASGAVYAFSRSGTTWTQQAYIKASNSQADDAFGTSIALSDNGDVIAVGAIGEDSSATGVNGDQARNTAERSGAVYILVRSSGSWTQQAYIKASNTGAFDLFGTSVALSGGGTTLAVGSPQEESASSGPNSDQNNNSAPSAGAVYVFTRGLGGWAQEAYIKSTKTDSGDQFGVCLSLSSDGQLLAVGAPWEASSAKGVGGDQSDNSASGTGAAYLYTRQQATWAPLAYLKASNGDAPDLFGTAVALSGTGSRLLIAAPRESGAATGVNGDQADKSVPESGAVYLFDR
jgi:hypothetical protein